MDNMLSTLKLPTHGFSSELLQKLTDQEYDKLKDKIFLSSKCHYHSSPDCEAIDADYIMWNSNVYQIINMPEGVHIFNTHEIDVDGNKWWPARMKIDWPIYMKKKTGEQTLEGFDLYTYRFKEKERLGFTFNGREYVSSSYKVIFDADSFCED